MKRAFMTAFVVLVFSACSNNSSNQRFDDKGQQDTRSSMKRVERNAGEMVEEANHGIQRGVNALDKSWETPRERDTEDRDDNR